MALFSRSFRRTYLRPRASIILFTVIIFLDAILISNSLPPETRVTPSYATPPSRRIFIASMFRNSEYILWLTWSASLLSLVQYLGPQNVYVSILESGSQDDTKGALLRLQADLDTLGVPNRIQLGINQTEQMVMLKDLPEEDEKKGWIFTGRKSGKDGWEKRRIPYLAELRNRVMEPFYELSKEEAKWDKILWINDVVFNNEDVTTLLSTNAGSYAAACSLDYNKIPTQYYDTFALRDSLGRKTASLQWPYFSSPLSLSAIRSNAPIPVKSCWNGMVAFDPAPFYSSSSPDGRGLKFRGVEDSLAKQHVEGSECCLIHADNKGLREEKGVWVNPNVRVSYNASTYELVNPKTDDGERGRWPGTMEMVRGVWVNRRARWFGRVRLWSEARLVRRRVEGWVKAGKKEGVEGREVGMECLVNEMQVLFESGWQHV